MQLGGCVVGAFDDQKLVAVASVDRTRRGSKMDFCKMDILYVSKSHRTKGIGKMLLQECKKIAQEFGALRLYISSTPTRNTVDFYLRNGAALTQEVIRDLYDLEPYDIHLELKLTE